MPFVTRLSLALEAGLVLPPGPLAVWGVTPQTGLDDAPEILVISRDARVHDRMKDLERHVIEMSGGSHGATAVLLPREKRRAQSFLAEAAAASAGPLIVDGQKTDGIEPMLKALRQRGAVSAAISKAHGKIFWMQDAPDLTDWAATPSEVEGLQTAPGVFSEARVDAGSRLLVEALPAKLGHAIADLGAGWGWISSRIAGEGREIHMVEADGIALDCARANVPGALAHWADVTRWHSPRLFDTVVMNPPFHEGRRGVPDLGRAFITSAARMLKPAGHLYMVANRHLPYEDVLGQLFAQSTEIGGDNRFKVLHATRPSRRRG